MLSIEFVTNFMYEYFENVTVSKNGTQFNARCSLCGDSKKSKRKKRFNLKYDGDNTVFRCFNCDESGKFKKLYFLITGEKYKNYDYDNFNELKNRFKKDKLLLKKELKEINKKIYYNEILKDCIGLDDEVDSLYLKRYKQILIKFYKDRNISKKYKLYISYIGEYKDRIIIPIYEGNNIVYFQARRIFKNMILKYKNPPHKKGYIILNKDFFNKEKYIILTEGILDAFSVGKQGTSCLGKSIDKDYIKKIFNFTNIGIVVSFDSDSAGIESVKKHYDNVFRYFDNIKYFILPKEYRKYKDINKFKVVTKIKNIYEYVLENSYSYEGYIVRI